MGCCEHMCVCAPCRAANADRQLGTRTNNEIQMTRGGGGGWGNQVGEVRGERVGRERARQGKATAQADLFSPNVQGSLVKMSTLLGIFQDSDADSPLSGHPTPPSLRQTRAESRTQRTAALCWLRRGRARQHLPALLRGLSAACQRPRAPRS